MGMWRDIALFNLVFPDKVSPEVKKVLQAKWVQEVTQPKKKSGLEKVTSAVTGGLLSTMGLATAAVAQPKKTYNTVKNVSGDIIHTAGKVAGNLGQSSINVIKETAKGNIGKAVSNAANLATAGTMDFTGGKRGIVNIHATKYINAALGGGAAAPKINQSTSLLPDTTITKKKTGLLTQLRQAKGKIGGGSYTEAVKNPLGGLAGKTGR